ncbi:MAG: hypothetical protein IIC82_08385, partial [Chloroflexi bacterium]|nr:hypothetical protein [Chloroflexota bacterium]
MNLISDKRMPIMDPDDPQFMRFRFPGTTTLFSASGPFDPFIKGIAQSGKAIAEGDPERALEIWERVAKNKASIPIRAIEFAGKVIFSEDPRTFEGRPIEKDAKGVVVGFFRDVTGAPIGIEETVTGILEGRPEAAVEMVGLAARGSPFTQMDVLFREQKDINPEGRSFKDANRAQKQTMEQRYPELAAQMDARSRGSFGTANRKLNTAREETHDRALEVWKEWSPKMLRGEPGAASSFRDDMSTLLSELAGARRAIYRDLQTEDGRDPVDSLDAAIFAYWDLLFTPISEGGAQKPSGFINWTVFDAKQTELERQWRETSLEEFGQPDFIQTWVEENSGVQDMPEALQPFFELTRQLRQLDWSNVHRQLRQWEGWSPAMKQFVEKGIEASRDNRFNAWLEGFDDPAAAGEKFNDVGRLIDKKKAKIQQENDELD